MGTLVKTNGNLFPTIPSFFDDLLTRDLFSRSSHNSTSVDTLPAVNIQETSSSYELKLAAPGMKKDDFNIQLDNDKLIISVEKESENEEIQDDGAFTRREFRYQSFRRSFNLLERMIEGDKISAKYKDGILHITVPKSEVAKVKPARQILIS